MIGLGLPQVKVSGEVGLMCLDVFLVDDKGISPMNVKEIKGGVIYVRIILMIRNIAERMCLGLITL